MIKFVNADNDNRLSLSRLEDFNLYSKKAVEMCIIEKLKDYLKMSSNLKYNDFRKTFNCPFCNGKGSREASCTVEDNGTIYNCSMCYSKGNIFDLFRKLEKQLENNKIINILAERFQVYEELSKGHFDVTDAETLANAELKEAKFIVSALIPQGLSILAGSPKVGKSWLVLWLCNQVACGVKVWDYDVLQGATLYLSLEDNERRLQNRLLSITETPSPNLYFATIANSINEGLDSQINSFMSEHNDTNLIVIDTLQRVRNATGKNSLYSTDYEDICYLKALADKHDIAILIVHHMRKMQDNDPFNMFSGSTGIIGAVDSAMALVKESRMSNKATIQITGRDDADKILMLEFNHDTFIWDMVSSNAEEYIKQQTFEESSVITALIKFIGDVKSWDGTATELIEILGGYAVGIPTLPNKLTREINMYKDELLARNINFSSKLTKGKRLIHINLSLPPFSSLDTVI